MKWQIVAYVVACVAVPIGWGLFVVWASNRIEKALRQRRKLSRPDDPDEDSIPPIEYHI